MQGTLGTLSNNKKKKIKRKRGWDLQKSQILLHFITYMSTSFFVTFKWRRGIQTLGLSPLITLGNDILPKFQQCSILFEH